MEQNFRDIVAEMEMRHAKEANAAEWREVALRKAMESKDEVIRKTKEENERLRSDIEFWKAVVSSLENSNIEIE